MATIVYKPDGNWPSSERISSNISTMLKYMFRVFASHLNVQFQAISK